MNQYWACSRRSLSKTKHDSRQRYRSGEWKAEGSLGRVALWTRPDPDFLRFYTHPLLWLLSRRLPSHSVLLVKRLKLLTSTVETSVKTASLQWSLLLSNLSKTTNSPHQRFQATYSNKWTFLFLLSKPPLFFQLFFIFFQLSAKYIQTCIAASQHRSNSTMKRPFERPHFRGC